MCPCSNREGACPSLLPDGCMNHDNANGSEVVEAVLQRLDKSHIFPADHRFMRRVAYVETRNGTVTTATNTSHNLCHKAVGMWGITENMLRSMKVEIKSNVTKYRELITASEDICAEFGVNVTGPEKLNMRNPLVSGIAARFYFYYQVLLNNMALPNNELPEDLEGQAIFFKESYTKADFNKFLKDVNYQEGKTENIFIY